MKVVRLHTWPRNGKAAVSLQRKLAARVRLTPVTRNATLLAGADLSISPDGKRLIAGIVVWDLKSHDIVETRVVCVACAFPYVPGLLSFREMPGILAAVRKLRITPDVFLCDAHGLAHPRRFGLACHLGLWLNIPTIGCAKSRLCGEHAEPGLKKGSSARLIHRGEHIGRVLRTREDVKPIYVSPGHLCDHDSARRIALSAAIKYRLPEPTRLAHQLVTRARTTRAAM